MTTDDDLFRQAMEGVAPLEEDDTKPHRLPVQHRAEKPARVRAGRPVEFQMDVFGGHVEGRAPGVGREPLKKLRRGKIPIDLTLDLHGLSEADARDEVREALDSVWERGGRCVEIIHGKGLHSEGWPVLKERLPGWLAEPPHGRRILAFSTVPANPGTMWVLLRKRR
jgi:DNA-nicking Smr family endonuclease